MRLLDFRVLFFFRWYSRFSEWVRGLEVTKRLDELLKKREQLTAQIQQVRAREAGQKRKEETRKKILLGALMMDMMDKGELDKGKVKKRLDGFLVKAGDRLLFGLSVKQGG